MTYGVTPEGFTRPSEDEIAESIEREQKATIDPTLDVATDPVVGQINGIVAQHLGKAWEALEKIYYGFDADKAAEDLLLSLGKLTRTKLRGATFTRVTLQCEFSKAGVLLEAGVHFANVEDDPDVRFTPVEDFTSPSDGIHNVVFRAELTGPIVPVVGTIRIVATPVTGWEGVDNPSVAEPGRNVETEDEFRERREADVDKAGSARVKAIRTDVLQVPGVLSVRAFENTTGLRDTVTGLPPHSFEMCVWAGDPAGATPDAIGLAIYESRAGGGQSHGGTTGVAGIAELGDYPPVNIERFRFASKRDVYLRFDVVPGAGWVGEAEFATAIATELNAMHDIGDKVVSERVQALCFSSRLALGVEDLVLFAQGFGASPTEEDNLGIASREIARFDTAGGRLVVNVVP